MYTVYTLQGGSFIISRLIISKSIDVFEHFPYNFKSIFPFLNDNIYF